MRAVTAHDARYTLELSRDSRFTRSQLAEHVARYPDLAYCTTPGQYVVGAFWRQRAEIGAIVELEGSTDQKPLLEALLAAYRTRKTHLVVVDPREQQRGSSCYANGLGVIDTIVQLECHGLRVGPRASIGVIRAMAEDDLPAVLDVERHSFSWLWWNSEAELRWYATVSGVELYVAEAEHGHVVGYAGFTVLDRQAHLDRLAVHGDYQRRGYARALLSDAMRRMASLGARRVALTTQIDNKPARELYTSFGFRDSGWRHDIRGIWLR